MFQFAVFGSILRHLDLLPPHQKSRCQQYSSTGDRDAIDIGDGITNSIRSKVFDFSSAVTDDGRVPTSKSGRDLIRGIAPPVERGLQSVEANVLEHCACEGQGQGTTADLRHVDETDDLCCSLRSGFDDGDGVRNLQCQAAPSSNQDLKSVNTSYGCFGRDEEHHDASDQGKHTGDDVPSGVKVEFRQQNPGQEGREDQKEDERQEIDCNRDSAGSLCEFEEERNIVDVEEVDSTAARSADVQQHQRPALDAPHREDAVFFGRQEHGPLLQHEEDGCDSSDGPKGDDRAGVPWPLRATVCTGGDEESVRCGVEQEAEPIQVLKPGQNGFAAVGALAGEPEDVDRGGSRCEDEVDVEGPLYTRSVSEVGDS